MTVLMGLLNIHPGLAEEQSGVSALLAARLEQERAANRENMVPVKFGRGQLRDANATEVLAVLSSYQNDPCWPVRHLAFRYAVWLAELQPQPATRSEVVKQLLQGFIKGADRQAANWLLTFKAEDFSGESKALIRQSLAKERPSRGIVLVCGVACMEDQLPILEKMLIDEMKPQAKVERQHGGITWYYTRGWAARLARARMGVKEDINKCLELVETVEDLDRRVITLLRDVGYIRQQEAIEHLQKYLESDKRLSPVSPPVPGKPVASCVLDILIDCLKDFPVVRKPGRGYKAEQIEQARQWMKQQKQWNIIR